VLPTSRTYSVEVGVAGNEITHFAANAQEPKYIHIQPTAKVKNAAISSAPTGIGLIVDMRLAFFKSPEPASYGRVRR